MHPTRRPSSRKAAEYKHLFGSLYLVYSVQGYRQAMRKYCGGTAPRATFDKVENHYPDHYPAAVQFYTTFFPNDKLTLGTSVLPAQELKRLLE